MPNILKNFGGFNIDKKIPALSAILNLFFMDIQYTFLPLFPNFLTLFLFNLLGDLGAEGGDN